MPFAKRALSGEIVQVSMTPAPGFEAVGLGEPRLIDFLSSALDAAQLEALGAAASELAGTDSQMARIVEDLLLALLAKDILRDSDLPRQAIAAIDRRRQLRRTIQSLFAAAGA